MKTFRSSRGVGKASLSTPEHALHHELLRSDARNTTRSHAILDTISNKMECQRVLREEQITTMNNNMAILVAAEKCDRPFTAASYCMEQLIL